MTLHHRELPSLLTSRPSTALPSAVVSSLAHRSSTAARASSCLLHPRAEPPLPCLDPSLPAAPPSSPPVQDGAGAGRELQPPKLIATIPAHKLVYPEGLVECGSEILVLGHNDLSGSQILVCKLADLVLQRFIPTKDIRGNTLFLEERNISVSSKVLPTVKGDNVVFIRSGRPYLAQYHLGSGSLSPAIDNCSLYGRGT
ncbi:hypothetical protein SEVIR_7G309400v4 [Setaria viridis]|uniref:Uncharacterized protein n=2 Tax=Setaria TaxID=4554 RepID=A0A368S1E7_SETIT|nr:hypothetical protein SETIT_7G297700v2 [Setaria italica]RCV36163.1 hypothetical protein SETIT_7G297700v2 [Setaria italica]RCV36164.1 hypothetical protein SETIT_7G297700v2 [Setaria italica]